MRTLGWLVALIANLAIAVCFAALVMDAESPLKVRAICAVIAVVFFAATFLLALAKASRLPSQGLKIMRYLCVAIPVLWLAGSLDSGTISGQELLSTLLIGLLSWGTWYAFKLTAAKA